MRAARLASVLEHVERRSRRFVINCIARGQYKSIIKNNKNGLRICKPLAFAERYQIKRYCQLRFGSSSHTPWLNFYTVFSGRFVEGWMPDDFFGQHVLPKVNKAYRAVGEAKTLTRRLLASNCLPDLAYYVGGMWFDADWSATCSNEIQKKIFCAYDRVFLKADMGRRGRAIWPLSEDEFQTFPFREFDDLVVQKPLKQALWLDALSPSCVATLRITTAYTSDRGPHARAAYLRAGTGSAPYIKEGGFVRCPVYLEEGRLAPYGCDNSFRFVREHPDTKFVFSGAEVPHLKDAVEMCEDLHKRVPHFMIIGWDVALLESGNAQIMEWNTRHPGISFSEAATGPIFSGLGLEEIGRMV